MWLWLIFCIKEFSELFFFAFLFFFIWNFRIFLIYVCSFFNRFDLKFATENRKVIFLENYGGKNSKQGDCIYNKPCKGFVYTSQDDCALLVMFFWGNSPSPFRISFKKIMGKIILCFLNIYLYPLFEV